MGSRFDYPSSKSWTRPFPFHIALIPLRSVWIQLFYHLWVNSRTDWLFNSCMAASQGDGKLNSNRLSLCHILLMWRGWIYTYTKASLNISLPSTLSGWQSVKSPSLLRSGVLNQTHCLSSNDYFFLITYLFVFLVIMISLSLKYCA